MLFAAVAYVWLAENHAEAAKDVWAYAKVTLFGVISLVLGYYFGKREK